VNGLANAERFAAEGAFVYITGCRQAQLDAAVKKIGSSGKAVQAGVSKPADLDRLYARGGFIGSTSVTLVGSTAWVSEEQLAFQSPSLPFRIYAVPLTGE
jgi:hypothetical protein